MFYDVTTSQRTKPVQYYLPQIHELYDRIKHSKFLSMLDLKSAYHQAPLAEESRFKGSFKCELGAFRYKVLSMGLVSSAAYYQRFVESKLDRHGILYRKVSATATDEDVYIASDGMMTRPPRSTTSANLVSSSRPLRHGWTG